MDVVRWGRLSGKQQWDILVALRGPDCGNSEIIKWFTTGVIRGEMAPVMRVGGTVNSDLRCVVLPEKFQETYLVPGGTMPWNSGHFFQHVSEAATILGLPLVVIKQEQWDKAMQKGSTDAVAILLEGIEEGAESAGAKELKRYAEYIGLRRASKSKPSPFSAVDTLAASGWKVSNG